MSVSKAIVLLLEVYSPVVVARLTYEPLAASTAEVSEIDFKTSQSLAALQPRYSACDRSDICDGKKLVEPFKCSSDPSPNMAFLKLKGDVIFYDAKMAIDADG